MQGKPFVTLRYVAMEKIKNACARDRFELRNYVTAKMMFVSCSINPHNYNIYCSRLFAWPNFYLLEDLRLQCSY